MSRQLLLLAALVSVHATTLLVVGRTAPPAPAQVVIRELPPRVGRCQVDTPITPPRAVAAAPVIQLPVRVVPRAEIERWRGDPLHALGGARVVPAVRDGRPDGFKLYAIRPDSPLARLGLENGDTIHTIGGYDVSAPDKALTAYTLLSSASRIDVRLTRQGVEMTLPIDVVGATP